MKKMYCELCICQYDFVEQTIIILPTCVAITSSDQNESNKELVQECYYIVNITLNQFSILKCNRKLCLCQFWSKTLACQTIEILLLAKN